MGHADDSRRLGSPALGRLFDDLLPMARRSRSRAETIARRFITRPQPTRVQPFMERWRLIIQGNVQGVGFRSACCRRALSHPLSIEISYHFGSEPSGTSPGSNFAGSGSGQRLVLCVYSMLQ